MGESKCFICSVIFTHSPYAHFHEGEICSKECYRQYIKVRREHSAQILERSRQSLKLQSGSNEKEKQLD